MDKNILIYGGTTEGRKLAEELCRSGFSCTVCVATEYGEMVMEELPRLTVRKGRMNAAKMREMTENGRFSAVVDATHPFAAEVSENIKESLQGLPIMYLRLKRDTEGEIGVPNRVRWFSDTASCAMALEEMQGNILLTTGSKELSCFCRKGLKERLYARVLPGQESIALCEKEGICGRHIIAMQGPFSVAMNEAIIRQFGISCLVTKESGIAGGFFEKLKAAGNTGAFVFIIGNPEKEKEGFSFNDTLEKLYELAGEPDEEKIVMHISLIGMGMGNQKHLTPAATEALEGAEIIFGAKRLLEQAGQLKEQYPYYLPGDILPKLAEIKDRYCGRESMPEGSFFKRRNIINAAVLFSGDTGFYSGAEKLYRALEQEKNNWGCNVEIEIFPGISSMSYLASKAGISWSDAAVVSIHGRRADILKTVAQHKKTFVLVSGVDDMQRIGGLLCGFCNQNVMVLMGYQLSYPQEEVRRMTPAECRELNQEGLYCCFIENPKAGDLPEKTAITHGIKDDCFIRGGVPMTKEEVREISICKLKLTPNAVLYDIGSGTGSIAVEAALLSKDILVYAIERKAEAAELIQKNCEKFQSANVNIVKANAPAGLDGLPVPTHAFIGGSGGNIREILGILYQRNPRLRVVMNAVTLETAGSMVQLLKEFPITEEEIVQVQVSRSKMAGAYHLMQAENPVTVMAFRFRET